MPMLDVYIPEGAIEKTAENQLLSKLTDILLEWEGADPSDPIARGIAWVYLHRPAAHFIAGKPTQTPAYRVVVSVPEGQLDNSRRAGVVAAVTEAILDAEPSDRKRDPDRVWVFANQIPEGTWGGGGQIFKLADIATMVLGNADSGKAHAKKRLAIVKAEREAVFD